MTGFAPLRHPPLVPVRKADVDLGKLIRGVSEECAAMSDSLTAIQAAIGDMLAATGAQPDAATVRAMQEIDLATQAIACLAHLNGVLAERTSGIQIRNEGLEDTILLHSLAERIFRHAKNPEG